MLVISILFVISWSPYQGWRQDLPDGGTDSPKGEPETRSLGQFRSRREVGKVVPMLVAVGVFGGCVPTDITYRYGSLAGGCPGYVAGIRLRRKRLHNMIADDTENPTRDV
ncbi:hypothetical protein HOLleu_06575 [Holothuria leucospilota]|uniref:Uncharacterized protein n=1 Tax=Holothuria leucospilota TaxID=206669 RepID=A0A9Q1CMB3_HOLLE|nr:hypothetical protein HOLleu_06575 [Holothuria leucospilota]